MKTVDIIKNKTGFSVEIFPPKPGVSENVIYNTLEELSGIHPDFISVTYGANGGKNGCNTIKIASDIKSKYNVESVAHMPCVNLTKEEATSILDDMKNAGIENILALRGDKYDNQTNGDFAHASDLIRFIKDNYDFNILAACYPEVHPESRNVIEDINWLKYKVECGTDELITQLFLDNDLFYDFYDRTKIARINVPTLAGIMPVTNKNQIERMVKMCGIKLPKKFMRIIERYEYDEIALRDAGIAYATDQIADLIASGIDGIHLYTMNNAYVAHKIYKAIYSLIAA